MNVRKGAEEAIFIVRRKEEGFQQEIRPGVAPSNIVRSLSGSSLPWADAKYSVL